MLKKIWSHTVCKILVFVGVISIFNYFLIGWHYKSQVKSEQTEYGVSFSTKYAEELGLDWQDAFTALTEDLVFKKLRLMSYWDLHEPENEQYDFIDLDWQIEQAEEQGIEVVLALGARQPRYPECHIPGWADGLEDQAFDDQLIEYIETVVNRYKDSPAIEAWQVENEPRNVVFSTCRPYFDRDRLSRELAAVKAIDSSRPSYMNLSVEHQLPLQGPIGDRVGYSIYERVNATVLGKNIAWEHRIPTSWHSFRSGLIGLFWNRQTYVHELQAEPWGPQATVALSQEEQAKSMNPRFLLENIDYAEKTGANLVYLWGGEWWYWQKTVNNDSAMWEVVDQLIINE